MIMDFHPLREARLEDLHPFFDLRDNYSCDSTLFDTVLWDGYYRVLFTIQGHILYLKPSHPAHPEAALPVCSAEDLPGAILTLQKHFHEDLRLPLTIPYVDEDACRLLREALPQFRYTRMPDISDYLYDGDALRSLSGKKYHKKKNHVNSFRKQYEGRFEYCTLTEADHAEIMDFLERWMAVREDTNGSLRHELNGLRTTLRLLTQLKAQAAGVRVDGRLEAFTAGTLNERLNMAIIHTEKADPEIDGLYAFIHQEFLLRAFPTAQLVNREDDMGLPALRQAKESYHPLRLLDKWILEE